MRPRQVLLNLLSNAIELNRTGGRARVDLRRAADGDAWPVLLIAVTDCEPARCAQPSNSAVDHNHCAGLSSFRR